MSTALLALSFVVAMPLSAMAGQERDQRPDGAADRVTDVRHGLTTDKPARDDAPDRAPQRDTVTDDRPSHVCDQRPTDAPRRCVGDKETDTRPIHRCLRIADNPRRCLQVDVSDHINIRHLIWRLIHAHEWKQLFRLLHWLGWV